MLVLDKYGRVRLSIENASIFTSSPEEVSDRTKNLLKQHANSNKDLAPQVYTLDGIKLMDFTSLTAYEHISKAVHDELKKANTKNVATIVRVCLNRKRYGLSYVREQMVTLVCERANGGKDEHCYELEQEYCKAAFMPLQCFGLLIQ